MTGTAKGSSGSHTNEDLFSQGWLDRHIDAVVTEMAHWPASFRPQLTGTRAQVMQGFDWDKYKHMPHEDHH